MNLTTNSTNVNSSSINAFASVMSTISNVATYTSMGLHIVYYIFIVVSKSLRKRTMLYANHAILASSFYLIISIGYIPSQYPSFADPNVNRLFCSISEIFWIFSSYIRMYSIFLIAVYRYLAVFKIAWYQMINDSLVYLLLPLVFVWAISIGFPIGAKFIFHTSVSPILCLDGLSNSINETWSYFFFNFTIMAFFPTVSIIVIYFMITRKLNSMTQVLNKKRVVSLEITYSRWRPRTADAHRNRTSVELKRIDEKKFANQFLIMCTFMVLTVIGLSIFQLRNVIPNYFTVWSNNGYTKVVKTWVVCNIAANPITSIYYHPGRRKFMEKISSRIKPVP